MTPDTTPLIYFGKIPSRGDFIRARSHAQEIDSIDHWISEALAHSERLFYQTPCIYFSHVNTAEQSSITGTVIPSHDSTDRSYPLIGFALEYTDKPKSWLNYLPVKSSSLWDTTYEAVCAAKQQQSDTEANNLLNNCSLSIDRNASTYYYDFINKMTLDDFSRFIEQSKTQLIEKIIATGLLFLPTYTKGFHGLNKALCWTLARDKQTSIMLATFWHDLIHGFYQPHEMTLNTYLYQIKDQYHMTLSFGAPSGRLLAQLALDGQKSGDDWVFIDDSEWTQSYIEDDIGLTRLQKLLSQDHLYLYDVRQLFKQIFLAQ